MQTGLGVYCRLLASLCRRLEGKFFDEFCEDIRSRGQIEPVVMQGDLILDGRNRVRVCEKLGKPVKQVQFDTLGLTITPEEYIWSRNVQRRHLTGDQRTAIAMQWRPRMMAEGRKAMAEGGKKSAPGRPEKGVVKNPNLSRQPKTRAKLAKLAGVAESRIAQAEKIKDRPDLLDAVKSGKTRLRDAVRRSKGEPQPTKRKAILEGAAKRGMIDILSQTAGMCSALEKIHILILHEACGVEEKKTWVASARKSASRLRKFAATFEEWKEGANK